MGTCREHSREDYTYTDSKEDLKLGCLQRIADAVEKMGVSYSKIIAERDCHERFAKNLRVENRRLVRSVSALRGVITRIKKAKVAKQEA